jgi:exodeoxyribonuclease-5
MSHRKLLNPKGNKMIEFIIGGLESESHSTETEEVEEVPFNPTPEQAEAVESIINWYRSNPEFSNWYRGDPEFYVLKGYAGTGKTYLMTYLAKSGLTTNDHEQPIKPHQICFTAPTNKAVKVLRNYLNDAKLAQCPTKTIYSLLGLSLQANGEVKELSHPEEPVDLSTFKLIVVDEGSMVNRFLMDAIETAFAEWHVPFLFMGDPAQLPPVGETTSPIWKIENQSLLTQVMRYGDSMLDLATSIRKVVDHPCPSVKISSAPPVYRVSKPAWFEKMVENLPLFKDGTAKTIAWRNVTVDKYNIFIRSHIFGTLEARSNVWLPEDKIVATSMLKNLDDETFMRTDEEATVLEVVLGHHPRHQEFEIWNLLCEDENKRKVTIRTLTPTGLFHLNNRLNELSMEAKGGKKYKWREFWQLKEAFNEIRHSYAITSHRSQGSSYLKTFVDLEDIMLNRNRQEAFRSLYVSCTRQRQEIYIA